MEEIIRGISVVDENEHVVVANYRPRTEPGTGVHVIEMATAPADHFGGRLLVFGRWVTQSQHESRIAAFENDPAKFSADHLKSLSS